jgi:putative ABC transport system ATP-binding protein
MIRAVELVRTFDDGARGEQRVLDRVSLEVPDGDFVAVVGRSGSGKSTLLNVLGGLDTRYGGEVHVAGRRITGLSDRALARFRNQDVGFVFQSFHLVPALSALDNVALPALFGDLPGPRTEQARSALERVGLEDKAERLPSQLSGGERQRVAVARALVMSPRLLLCDEPTGNLDAETADVIVSLLQALNADGLTVLVVTHEERLRAAAKRVLSMIRGRLA